MSLIPLPLSVYVESLKPYESARSLLKGNEWIFLDANESPCALAMLSPATPLLNRYPDPTADALRDAIAAYYGVQRGNLIIGNGSDELIDLSVRTFVRRNRSVLSFKPSYGMYKVSADINGVSYLSIDLDENLQLDEEQLLKIDGADLLFLCNPNNPTGTFIERDTIEKILKSFSGLVVIDEAYGEFAENEGRGSAIEFVKKGAKNLLVLRTFSKAFGAAGIRLGYGIGDIGIVDTLLKMKPPYNVNAMSQAVGLEFWQKRNLMEQNVKNLVLERKRLIEECEKLGCKSFPSVANFFLTQLPTGVSGADIYTRLKENNRIVLRKISGLPHSDSILRISIGSTEENNLLLSSLSTLL
jgi:histidinol-phosphate aminotransferase